MTGRVGLRNLCLLLAGRQLCLPSHGLAVYVLSCKLDVFARMLHLRLEQGKDPQLQSASLVR